jgi:predicted esterase
VTELEEERRKTQPRLGPVRAISLSLLSIGAGGALAVATICALAGAWTLALHAAGAALLPAALGLALFPRRALRIAAAIAAALGLAHVLPNALPIALAPVEGAPLETRWLGADRVPWFGRVPEREVVRVGAWVGLLPEERKRSQDMKLFLDEYDAIERARPFVHPESQLLDSWLMGHPGHFWLARPERADRSPLLVFLHGNGGSFQVYASWLGPAARARGVVAAFPTCGLGLWPDADEHVRATIDRVASEVAIDRRRVWLCGLSAGGWAAFEAFEKHPELYAGVISISGVVPDPDTRKYAGKKVLAVHGAEDPRAPWSWAKNAVGTLRGAGVDARFHSFPHGDHFILMTDREAIVKEVLDLVSSP